MPNRPSISRRTRSKSTNRTRDLRHSKSRTIPSERCSRVRTNLRSAPSTSSLVCKKGGLTALANSHTLMKASLQETISECTLNQFSPKLEITLTLIEPIVYINLLNASESYLFLSTFAHNLPITASAFFT